MLPARRYQRQVVRVPMTALVDIVFLLLIYFLLTTNYLVSDTLPLELPSAKTSLPQNSQALTVSLDAEGVIYLAGKAVAGNELATGLCAVLADNALQPLVIRSDGKVELSKVVKVLDMARTCGAVSISLATDSNSSVH